MSTESNPNVNDLRYFNLPLCPYKLKNHFEEKKKTTFLLEDTVKTSRDKHRSIGMNNCGKQLSGTQRKKERHLCRSCLLKGKQPK